jgi:hypothetical protein
VKTPVVMTFAAALPLIDPMSALTSTATLAGRPHSRQAIA